MTRSPTRLREAGYFAGVRHFAQTETTEAEFAIYRTSATAFLTARVSTHLELWRRGRFDNE